MSKTMTPFVAVFSLLAGLFAVAMNTAHSDTVGHEECRPDGLYPTPGVETPYCLVYDTAGREQMGADHPRRVIGYFTSWRHGKNGQPSYLVTDIPWDNVTHINYAFAHVDQQNRIAVGSQWADNPATDMTWPGVPGAEMDPSYGYTGHFNLLNKYKKQHPEVKTLISVGGWAESGGIIQPDGTRLDTGGFYTMTTNADGSVNTAGINTFADSVVEFLRAYGFDGVDIDYEYPTSMRDAGNPLDFPVANARRAGLMRSFVVLMKTLREKLDQAAAQDGGYYMLTHAATASGWLTRGMEAYQVTQYLDYVNLMTYDLHGAWNQFVGPNAALYDDGRDAELAFWGVYSAPQYKGIGYLNTDWAYHYYRGAMPPGRINIGLPFYTRGWRNVNGGSSGLWGTSELPDQSQCPDGTGTGQQQCGDGAVGIDNLWHDVGTNGAEMPAGSNPMWHAMNLEREITPSYLGDYGLDPENDPEDRITGDYVRNFDSTLVAPWLWNSEKRVFLSTEDTQSLRAKLDYVVGNGIGGVMMWELAGDFDWYPDRNGGQGEYFMGDTLTTLMHETFRNAASYDNAKANEPMPREVLDISAELTGFPLGDSNYPISPTLVITNRSGRTLPGGTEFQFDVGTSAPSNIGQTSGWQLSVVRSDHPRNGNVGGLGGDFHRVSLRLPSWQSLPDGGTTRVDLTYQLPMAGPSNFTVTLDGTDYALTSDYARGTTAPPTTTPPTTPSDCAAPAWDAGTVYTGGDVVSHEGHEWRAKWWTRGEEPGTTGQWGVWQGLGPCGAA